MLSGRNQLQKASARLFIHRIPLIQRSTSESPSRTLARYKNIHISCLWRLAHVTIVPTCPARHNRLQTSGASQCRQIAGIVAASRAGFVSFNPGLTWSAEIAAARRECSAASRRLGRQIGRILARRKRSRCAPETSTLGRRVCHHQEGARDNVRRWRTR